MKLRLLVLCLALAVSNVAARAQDNPSQVNPSTDSEIKVGPTDVGLYVNPVGIHITNSKADSGTFAFLGDNTTARTFYGASIGGYVNFYHAPRFDAGIDVRDTIVSSNNAHLNSFLVGARVMEVYPCHHPDPGCTSHPPANPCRRSAPQTTSGWTTSLGARAAEMPLTVTLS